MPITLEKLRSIQAECFADDLDIDFERMRLWSAEMATAWFESGGSFKMPPNTNAEMAVQLGACGPMAPIPDIPPPPDNDLPAAAATAPASSSEAPLPDAGRIYCVSDLHTDHNQNLTWCRSLHAQGGRFKRDVLIIAGDVTSSLEILRVTLELLAKTFAKVFYIEGNHDLWVKGKLSGGLHIRPVPIDSLQKLGEVQALCASLGVATEPAYAAGAIVVPLHSWYHASWDKEPEIIGWDGIPTAETTMMDFHLCKWPPELDPKTDSLARHFDRMNDETGTTGTGAPSLDARVAALRAAHPSAPLITFSHFVPLQELFPEKRYLFHPPLSKVSGSEFLAKRIRGLRPDVHVFGRARCF